MLKKLAVPAPCRLPLPAATVELPTEPPTVRKPRAPRKGKGKARKSKATVALYDADGIRLPSGGHRPMPAVDAHGILRPDTTGRIVHAGAVVGDHRPPVKVRARRARRPDGLSAAQWAGIAAVRTMRDTIDATSADDVARAVAWRAALLPAGQRAARGTMPTVGPWIGEDSAADDAETLWEGLQGIALLACRSEFDAAEAAALLWTALADGKPISRPIAYVRAVARRHERRRERAAARRREHRDGLAAAQYATARVDAAVIGRALADLSASLVAVSVAEEGVREAGTDRDWETARKRAGRARSRLERIVENAMANL